jgi:hypothetical protein
MPHVSLDDFRKIIQSLQIDGNDPRVHWSLVLPQEVRRLLGLLCTEVGRAHGRRVTLEEVLEFVLQAHEQGRWPAGVPVVGTLGESPLLQAPSLARRWGPPDHGVATFVCVKCHLAWQHGPTGELVFPARQRVQEALLHADRISWLPAGHGHHEPHPDDVELPARALREQVVAEDGGCMVPGCVHGPGGKPAPLQALPLELLVGSSAPEFIAGDPGRQLLTVCIPHLRALLRDRMQLRVDLDGSLIFDVRLDPPPGRRPRPWRTLRGIRTVPAPCDLERLQQEVASAGRRTERNTHPPPDDATPPG